MVIVTEYAALSTSDQFSGSREIGSENRNTNRNLKPNLPQKPAFSIPHLVLAKRTHTHLKLTRQDARYRPIQRYMY